MTEVCKKCEGHRSNLSDCEDLCTWCCKQEKIVTEYNPKPIPMRQFDWDAWHSDFEIVSHGATEEEAVQNLMMEIE